MFLLQNEDAEKEDMSNIERDTKEIKLKTDEGLYLCVNVDDLAVMIIACQVHTELSQLTIKEFLYDEGERQR